MRNTNPNHEIEEPRREEMSKSYQISVRPRPISPPQERTVARIECYGMSDAPMSAFARLADASRFRAQTISLPKFFEPTASETIRRMAQRPRSLTRQTITACIDRISHSVFHTVMLGVLADYLRLYRRSQWRDALGACHHWCLVR
jgi:hypothetical protein